MVHFKTVAFVDTIAYNIKAESSLMDEADIS